MISAMGLAGSKDLQADDEGKMFTIGTYFGMCTYNSSFLHLSIFNIKFLKGKQKKMTNTGSVFPQLLSDQRV